MPYQKLKAAGLMTICLLLQACGNTAPPLVASDVVVTEPLPGRGMSAAYLSLTNSTDADITITRVVSPEFARVEIHESSLEQGVSRMRQLPELVVPADSTITLAQGGKHLMLMRPKGEPAVVNISFYSDATLLLGISAPLTARNQ